MKMMDKKYHARYKIQENMHVHRPLLLLLKTWNSLTIYRINKQCKPLTLGKSLTIQAIPTSKQVNCVNYRPEILHA